MIAQSFKGLNYSRKLQCKPHKGDSLKKISNLRERIESLRTKLDPWRKRLNPLRIKNQSFGTDLRRIFFQDSILYFPFCNGFSEILGTRTLTARPRLNPCPIRIDPCEPKHSIRSKLWFFWRAWDGFWAKMHFSLKFLDGDKPFDEINLGHWMFL